MSLSSSGYDGAPRRDKRGYGGRPRRRGRIGQPCSDPEEADRRSGVEKQLGIISLFEQIISIAPLTWLGVLSAMSCGAIIGIERQMLGKPVGIRTGMLVCLSTYIFISISNAVASGTTDPSRVIGQIITGVGFLGAGVMMSRDGIVVGVTSAAAIWILAAIGVTIASQYYLTGIKLSLLAVIALVGVDMVENTFVAMQKGVHARLRLKRRK